MKKTLLPLFALASGFFAKINFAHALPKIEDPIVFESQVGLPGMGTATELTFGSTGYIGQMIKGFYDWGLAVGGILAAIMIMAGGVLWLSSAGSSDMVGRAKKMITGSIVGLLLLVGASMVLRTINPALIDMSGTDISEIKGIHYCCSPSKGIVLMEKDAKNEFVCPQDSSKCAYGEKCTSMPKTGDNGQVTNNFQCLDNSKWYCCEYEERNNKKCIPAYNTFCAAGNTIPYSNYDETEYHFVDKTNGYCIERKILKGNDCGDPCVDKDDGDGCGPQCNCYYGISVYGVAGEGESCGNRGGSICYSDNSQEAKGGKCQQLNGKELYSDSGGRSCGDNLTCCNFEKAL